MAWIVSFCMAATVTVPAPLPTVAVAVNDPPEDTATFDWATAPLNRIVTGVQPEEQNPDPVTVTTVPDGPDAGLTVTCGPVWATAGAAATRPQARNANTVTARRMKFMVMRRRSGAGGSRRRTFFIGLII